MKVIRKTLSSMSGISGLLVVVAFVLTLVAPVRAQEREYTTRVVEEMEHAWRLVGGGIDNKEAVLLLFRMDDGSIQARAAGLTNEQKSFTFKWSPSAIAILHTHPNSVDPQPSRPDRQLANKLGVPIFTLTVRGMYQYDPHTRKVTQIKRGLDWLELSKWKLMTLATRLATFDAGNVDKILLRPR